jgi:hypothetical protein
MSDNIIPFIPRPKTKVIKPENVDLICMSMKDGYTFNLPDNIRYKFVLWLKSQGINEYYID